MRYQWVMGLDEVGRGPLVGPVVAGACALIAKEPFHEITTQTDFLKALGVRDSKKVSAKKRRLILRELGVACENRPQKLSLQSPFFSSGLIAVAQSSALEIDQLNILAASHLAMVRAAAVLLDQLEGDGLMMIDGHLIPMELQKFGHKTECFIKGDDRIPIIGLASIFAKEYRDLLMEELDREYPDYGFSRHKGYPTQDHREALLRLGATPWHRMSFKTLKELA